MKRKSTAKAPLQVQAKRDSEKKSQDKLDAFPVSNLKTGAVMDNVSTLTESSLPLQPKLTIGQVGDKYEQEADQVAHDVVKQINAPTQEVQRDPQAEEEEDKVQRKPNLQLKGLGGETASHDIEANINQARGGGQSLDTGLQQSMGQAMGADFSQVTIHTDNTSEQLNQSLQAKAFTTGNDVFFGKGEYNPSTQGGQELIAHELTHVVQQTGPAVQRQPQDTTVQRVGLTEASEQLTSAPKRATANEALAVFDQIANTQTDRAMKLLHLKLEFSKENLFFLDAVDSYVNSPSQSKMIEIYNKYVSNNADLMINISSRNRSAITNSVLPYINNTTANDAPDYLPWIFHEATIEIAALMRDSAARYDQTVKNQQLIVMRNLIQSGMMDADALTPNEMSEANSAAKKCAKIAAEEQKQIKANLKTYPWYKRLLPSIRKEASEGVTHG